MSNEFKSGFIALLGRPNVGKSTLMNHLVGEKVAIVSDKPQTTRNQIRGVFTTEEGQIVFLDTPGIHKPASKLGERLVSAAVSALQEVDLILFLIDASGGLGSGDKYIIELLKTVKTPVFLVINKIDQVHPDALLPFIDKYQHLHDFREVVPISALQGNNTHRLVELTWSYLSEGPQYYPSEQLQDRPERFIIGEIIREKVLQLTREEIPHSIAVFVENMKMREGTDLIDISATIYTERQSQKGILIGKNGSLLKEVGRRARVDLEKIFGNRVFLELWIKVEKDWRNKDRKLKEFGYDNE